MDHWVLWKKPLWPINSPPNWHEANSPIELKNEKWDIKRESIAKYDTRLLYFVLNNAQLSCLIKQGDIWQRPGSKSKWFAPLISHFKEAKYSSVNLTNGPLAFTRTTGGQAKEEMQMSATNTKKKTGQKTQGFPKFTMGHISSFVLAVWGQLIKKFLGQRGCALPAYFSQTWGTQVSQLLPSHHLFFPSLLRYSLPK